MNYIFLISIVLKGIGAVLEVLLQILITRKLGVAEYGLYSTWINAADLIFWIFFSGLVKCNTFYISDKNTSIKKFRWKYYLRYVFPVIVLTSAISIIFGGRFYILVPCITVLELLVMDNSSEMIACGQATNAIIGEYVLGRLFLLIGAAVLMYTGHLNFYALIVLYLLQYICILFFFAARKRKENLYDVSEQISIKKWGIYQKADILQAMIGQMPIVLQYFFGGAFEAGVVSIVMLVKKLVNFISGPTAKIFLPEFSRFYHEGKKEKIRNSFESIMRMQMLFVSPMAVVLIGFPDVVLSILAKELLVYKNLFVLCSVVFLVAATLGPCGGLMQMTDNEKKDNDYREIAMVIMLLVMVLFSKDSLFVLYGLCIQTMVEAGGKYFFVCRWMEQAPVTMKQYIKWWCLPLAVIALAKILALKKSVTAMIFLSGMVFAVVFIQEWKNEKSAVRMIADRKKE